MFFVPAGDGDSAGEVDAILPDEARQPLNLGQIGGYALVFLRQRFLSRLQFLTLAGGLHDARLELPREHVALGAGNAGLADRLVAKFFGIAHPLVNGPRADAETLAKVFHGGCACAHRVFPFTLTHFTAISNSWLMPSSCPQIPSISPSITTGIFFPPLIVLATPLRPCLMSRRAKSL
jgi:hypothetical protein